MHSLNTYGPPFLRMITGAIKHKAKHSVYLNTVHTHTRDSTESPLRSESGFTLDRQCDAICLSPIIKGCVVTHWNCPQQQWLPLATCRSSRGGGNYYRYVLVIGSHTLIMKKHHPMLSADCTVAE